MNRTFKIILLGGAVVLASLAIYTVLRGTLLSTLVDRTVYPKGFSDAAFQKVAVGMAESEVIRLVGKPLETSWVQTPETWFFDERPGGAEGHKLFGGNERAILFGDDGTVSQVRWTDQAKVRAGMSKGEVKSLVGEPAHTCPASIKTFLYSRPGSPDSVYQLRKVSIDRKGQVSCVESSTVSLH